MKYLNYNLDAFQEQAIRAVDRGQSMIVAAPTGCGKTLIAEYAIEKAMREGRRSIYTAPIKALSNQKFRDFRRRFGDDSTGIQTGDITINKHAPILIMTTEIFRNQILEDASQVSDVQYVIFDEIHYLDDPERGTVWEESIILAPPHIRFMCLSATVPNIDELAGWMDNVRNERFEVIVEKHRPIPLIHTMYSPQYGTVTIKDLRKKYRKNPVERKRFIMARPPCRKIVRYVLDQGHFPILFFCFKRRACERNAEMHDRLNLLSQAEQSRAETMILELTAGYKLEGYDRLERMKELWMHGVAYHHAGILPAAKEIVERLFSAGLIKLLFCTETFALGVNMPASAVVFDELEKFDGVDFSYLATRQYHQMAGRAGRRGMDEVGYVYSQVVAEATDPKEVERILYGQNERISSRFYASYSTILNLYSRLGPGAFDLFRKSLRNYKAGEFVFSRPYQKEEEQIRARIKFLQSAKFLDGTDLTPKGKLAAAVNGYEIQAAELYYSRSFDECTPAQIPVVLAGIVTEEASRKSRGGTQASSVRLRFEAEKVISKLRKQEIQYGISFPIREMDLRYAAPVFAWAQGCSLMELESFGVPEGDMVRLLRMTIQLLRTLRDYIEDPIISERMDQAVSLINRGVVDAQAELEAGVNGNQQLI
jgi:superfamily II RNA helicase